MTEQYPPDPSSAPPPAGYQPPPAQPWGQPQWGAPQASQWQPQPFGYQPVGNAGTNGFAIASLVLSLVWLLGVGSILAVVFGIIALRQIKASPQGGKGLAIAGVSIGGVGLFFLVAAIAVPVFLNQREKGYDAEVRSALLNAATAEESFFTDNDRYASSLAELEAEGMERPPNVVLKLFATGNQYCIEGVSTRSRDTVWSLRTPGRLVRAGCP